MEKKQFKGVIKLDIPAIPFRMGAVPPDEAPEGAPNVSVRPL